MKDDIKKFGTSKKPLKTDGLGKITWLDPEEVTGTSNDCVITRCAVYLLLLAVCVVALIVTN